MAVEQVKFHFDPLCPWCYQTSRWAVRLEELGAVSLDWGVFSLEVVNLPEDQDPQQLEARSGPALRSAIAIRDSEGSPAIGRFYTALGKRVWEQAPPEQHNPDTVRAALADAGFDPELCDKALADPGTWEAVLEEHRALVERTRSFGVPTIVLDGGTGPAIFGPVVSQMPSDDDTLALWHHVSWLTRYENFSEVKRERSMPPDLPAAEWYRKEREKKKAEQG
ncbi:MAG TPA: DsbA family protein [Acidimicrobiales bacterium]|nr:DsbA family protein [Acidimicrobiales bacterium]